MIAEHQIDNDESNEIGIDLGTTYSCVGFRRNDAIEILADVSTGNRTVPSIVQYKEKNISVVVGEAARTEMKNHYRNTVFDSKRFIGRHMYDSTFIQDMQHWPFKVVSDDKDVPCVELEHNSETVHLYAVDVSSAILDHLKKSITAYSGKSVTGAIITVPAYFNNRQRKDTIQAALNAGLTVRRIINEPTAAAIGYAYENIDRKPDCNIMVYDFGGGTFDVSIISIVNNVITVKATGGDSHLGGEDFDNAMVEYYSKELLDKYNVDLKASDTKTQKRLIRLRQACEKTKCMLTNSDEALVNCDFFDDYPEVSSTFTRTLFYELNRELFKRSIDIAKTVLSESHLDINTIDEIVLVGGSSRIPIIPQMLQEAFTGAKISRETNPDEIVAKGAAILANKERLNKLFEVCDVIPRSLSTDITGGKVTKMLVKNSIIPCSTTKLFQTAKDFQETIDIKVFEGESELASENLLLDGFKVQIEKKRKGEITIEVTFSIDENGVLQVAAKDRNSDKLLDVRVVGL